MDISLIPLSAFAAVTIATFGVGSMLFDGLLRDRSRINARLRGEFTDGLRARVRQSALFKNLNEATWEELSAARALWRHAGRVLDQSGLQWPLERLLAASSGLCLVVCPAMLFAGFHWTLALAAAAVAFAILPLYVLLRRKRRLQALRDQLPEAFDLMSRAVRAGQTMASAMQLAAADGKPPLAKELAYCCEQQNLGLPQETAFREMALRGGVMELQMFAVAMLIQRQAGGSPIEVLDNLSKLVRKRSQLRNRVKALTSEGCMQALVLSALCPAALSAIYILNREYAQVLLSRPHLLLGIVASQALGALWIRKIVNFDY